MEYLPVVLFALIFFIVPMVGAIVFGWFWRYPVARGNSRTEERTRETQRPPRTESMNGKSRRAS
jgi:hypothetical protein